LGKGPDWTVRSYQGYDINGYTFYTIDQDQKSAVQNSGVTLTATSSKYDIQKHGKGAILKKVAKESYYGVIQRIWELDYREGIIIPVLHCRWVNNDRGGVQVDKYGFTQVNLTTNAYKSEPFVLARHVTQVFYVKDPNDRRYHIVMQGKRRILGVDNVTSEEEYDQFDELPPFSVGIEEPATDKVNRLRVLRDDIEGTYLD
jgi:hypothetical protein